MKPGLKIMFRILEDKIARGASRRVGRIPPVRWAREDNRSMLLIADRKVR